MPAPGTGSGFPEPFRDVETTSGVSMRTFALVLGLAAWLLSCAIGFSYVRARENAEIAEAAAQKADDTLTARVTAADANNELTERRLHDQRAVQRDELALGDAQTAGRDTSREQQALAEDRAKLEADRTSRYGGEDLARPTPDPQIAAARDDLDLYEKAASRWRAIQARDVKLIYALGGLWVLVAVVGFASPRRRHGSPMAHVF